MITSFIIITKDDIILPIIWHYSYNVHYLPAECNTILEPGMAKRHHLGDNSKTIALHRKPWEIRKEWLPEGLRDLIFGKSMHWLDRSRTLDACLYRLLTCGGSNISFVTHVRHRSSER